MADFKGLEEDAVSFAKRAVQCDKEGHVDTAVFYYTEAAQALISARNAGLQWPNLVERTNSYLNRAEVLKANKLLSTAFNDTPKTPQQCQTERAYFLLTKSLEEDELGNSSEALELYLQAAELCLQLKKESADETLKTKVSKMAAQALDRAEDLKRQTETKELGKVGKTVKHLPSLRPLGDALKEDDTCQSSSLRPNSTRPVGASYTKDELQVLKSTSVINGRQYVPFLDIDLKERFAYPVPFTDRDGFLTLSQKQLEKFGKWIRPDELSSEPILIYAISSFSIKQTIVSDCSFVASLAISAAYERRFKKKLITKIIYPQNRDGEPQYNPCGKYMIKLNINGVHRKVIVDDYLPLSKDGELLCSYSSNRNELWVSFLEKAYLKVMGGYDFPGSNSSIDLHALTGWIPERIPIRVKDKDFDPDREFERLFDKFHQGHCLITVATGEMSNADADRAGLVQAHAYAVLDLRKVKNYKLLQLKNPWSHMRWKGHWSEKDTQHWTDEMKALLNFDPKNAELFDNGVFWIDYESILHFYDMFYVNWNPDIFQYTSCTHHTWLAKIGPSKDVYSIADNPQFYLELKTNKPCAIWILLSRHITDKDDFANNKEFIIVLVYNSSEGKRVYYPYDPAPYKDGVRINSPHYLCKMVEDGKGSNLYTLVISQYEKSTTIHFTLRVYASCDFKLHRIAEPYIAKFEKQISGEWKGKTAGGCANYPETCSNNPIYQLNIDNNSTSNMIMIELKAPREFSVGMQLTKVAENVGGTPFSFDKKTTGTYRRGYCVLILDNVPGGVYNISLSTFYPNNEGPFILCVSANTTTAVAKLQ